MQKQIKNKTYCTQNNNVKYFASLFFSVIRTLSRFNVALPSLTFASNSSYVAQILWITRPRVESGLIYLWDNLQKCRPRCSRIWDSHRGTSVFLSASEAASGVPCQRLPLRDLRGRRLPSIEMNAFRWGDDGRFRFQRDFLLSVWAGLLSNKP